MKEYYTGKRVPIEYKESYSFWIGFFLLLGFLTLGYILDGNEDKPETREAHSIFDYRGDIESLTTVKKNDHCRIK